jgi:uncharacterized protein with HEPN domain
MIRDYKFFLKDIIESINYIEKYIKNISEIEFKKNVQIQDAVIRRIEIIGEASKKIPRSVKEINKEIPWEKLSLFRDFIVHSYFEASLNRVWRIIKYDFPALKEKIKLVKLL